jgi:hypothetical protein
VHGAFKQIKNGEFLFVASCDQLREAVRPIPEPNSDGPAEYQLRNSCGDDVKLAAMFAHARNIPPHSLSE